jgi:hypothetical protein
MRRDAVSNPNLVNIVIRSSSSKTTINTPLTVEVKPNSVRLANTMYVSRTKTCTTLEENVRPLLRRTNGNVI